MRGRWWRNSTRCSRRATCAEWRAILDAVGVTFGVVGKVDDAPDDPQMRAIGAMVPFADGERANGVDTFQLDGEDEGGAAACAEARAAQRGGAARGRLFARTRRADAELGCWVNPASAGQEQRSNSRGERLLRLARGFQSR